VVWGWLKQGARRVCSFTFFMQPGEFESPNGRPARLFPAFPFTELHPESADKVGKFRKNEKNCRNCEGPPHSRKPVLGQCSPATARGPRPMIDALGIEDIQRLLLATPFLPPPNPVPPSAPLEFQNMSGPLGRPLPDRTRNQDLPRRAPPLPRNVPDRSRKEMVCPEVYALLSNGDGRLKEIKKNCGRKFLSPKDLRSPPAPLRPMIPFFLQGSLRPKLWVSTKRCRLSPKVSPSPRTRAEIWVCVPKEQSNGRAPFWRKKKRYGLGAI